MNQKPNNCPCCGARNGEAHDPACALISYLQDAGFPPARPAEPAVIDIGTEKRMDATMLLDAAASHMRDRAATYDSPGGERSMGRTVLAFNTITGRSDASEQVCMALAKVNTLLGNIGQGLHPTNDGLIEMLHGIRQRLVDATSKSARVTESEGWLLMLLLKKVRDRQREKPHRDSLEDAISYAALEAEARLAE